MKYNTPRITGIAGNTGNFPSYVLEPPRVTERKEKVLAEATGISIEGENEWESVIQNATHKLTDVGD